MDEFAQLLARHRNALERFVRFRVSNAFDADDIIQEACLSAYRSFPALKDTSAFKPWLLRIARSKCCDYFRQLAKAAEIPLDRIAEKRLSYGRMGVTMASPVEETLQKLGYKDQQVLTLYYYRGLAQREIAKRLSVPVGTVKSRLHTAKANFKALYPAPQITEKGGNPMKSLPEYLPAYTIQQSDKAPFAVRFEELTGWFIIPRMHEMCTWAQYDMPERKITDIYSSTVEKKVVLHGIEGVEIKNTHRKAGAGPDEAAVFFFIAQLTDRYCRWLGNRYWEDGAEHILTFLDGDEFLSAWGAGENNAGEPVDMRPRGLIARSGDKISSDRDTATDCVGRYSVRLAGKTYDTNLLISLFHGGPLTEQYIDKTGRTVLWRRFNRDDWEIGKYGMKWSERFPENQRITVNGATYVHWYDCISDYVC